MLAATIVRLKRFLLTLLSLFRRVICIRKRRPSQDSLLPITISHGKGGVAVTNEPSTNYYSPTGSNSSPLVNSFNPNDHQHQQTPFVGVSPSINSPATAMTPNYSGASGGGQFSQFSQTANWNSFSSKQLAAFDQVKHQQQVVSANKSSVESQGEEAKEEDFFRDMAPRVKQQRFYNIKQDSHQGNQQQVRSDRFNFDPTVAAISSSVQLGQLDDIDIDSPTSGSNMTSTAWDEEVDTSEIEDQIRKVREEERRKRQAEHAARAKEKEKRNPNRTLSATKIS